MTIFSSEKYNIPAEYEGLRPGTYLGEGDSRVESPGTGRQDKLKSGIIAHSKSTLDPVTKKVRRYDPGIYFPWDRISKELK